MRVRVLALDYDGTIASAGELDQNARAALEEARSNGLVVIIVTGRMLDDLRAVAGDLGFATAVVAENGAVVAFPACDGRSLRLAGPPASELVEELRARGFHVDAGESIIAVSGSIAHDVLRSIRSHELPLVLVFNGESLMVLPQSVSKGTGLREALRLLGESRHNAVGIGDRENDHDLLRTCGAGAAVGWGSETLKASAQIVIAGTGPASVGDFVRRIARDPWIPPSLIRAELVPLGHAAARPVSLQIRGRNVLVVGDRHSGTSWVTGLICEQLIMIGYSTCVLDSDGSQSALANLPAVLKRRGHLPVRSAQVARALDTERSIVVDTSHFSNENRSKYAQELLTTLATQRRRLGRPHWIVIDSIDETPPMSLDAQSGGYVLACPSAAIVPADFWSTIEACVATRIASPDDVATLADRLGASTYELDRWRTLLTDLPDDEAVILSHSDHSPDTPAAIRLAERLTCLRRRKTTDPNRASAP